MSEENVSAAQGFAGFRSLVSDVAADIAAAERLHRDAVARPREVVSESPVSSKPASRANWPLIIGVGLAILFVIFLLNNQNGTSSSNYSSTYSSPDPYQPPAPAYDPPAEPSYNYSTDTTPDSGAVPYQYGEVLPPIGSDNVLSRAQIEYCLAESIRVDASRAATDDTSSDQVDRFNQSVGDFNQRCASYRYQQSDMTAAQASVDARRFQLQQEGASRFP